MATHNDFTDVFPNIEPQEDKIYRVSETIASLVPTGSSIFKAIFADPIQSRTELWMKEVEQKLVMLANNSRLDFSALSTRPEFSAILLKLIQEVEITSQKDKLSHLANFALNVALTPDIDVDFTFILTDILKSLTPSHIQALQLYHSPKHYDERFIELLYFTATHGSGGYVSLSFETAPKELATIFHEDRSANVMINHSDINNINEDYWTLINIQLGGHNLLMHKKNTHQFSAKVNGYEERDVTITLTSTVTQSGKCLLKFITSPI